MTKGGMLLHNENKYKKLFNDNSKRNSDNHCFIYNELTNNRSSHLKEFSIVQEDVIREALSDYTADEISQGKEEES